MDSMKLACGLTALGVLAGCSGADTYTFPQRDGECMNLDGTPCPAGRTDAERTVELPMGMPDATLTYIVSTIGLPEATPDPDGPGPLRSQAAGFDVDGLDSGDGSSDPAANCEEFNQDFVSLTDPNHVGVDNALQGLVGTIENLLDPADCPGMTTDGCLDANLQEQINSGNVLLLMEVSGVNDFQYDPEVQVQFHLAEVPGGGMPMVGDDGRLASGQTFASMQTLGPPVRGDIFAGRLAARTDVLPLTIRAGGFELVLMITQAQVRFDISQDAMMRGAIGGVVTVDAIVDAASAVMPGIEDTVRSVVESVADVDPSADDPAVCQAVSLGLTFEGTSATLQ